MGVRALVRPAAAAEARARLETVGVELVPGDIEDAGSLPRAVDGVSCVLSTATSFPRDDRPDHPLLRRAQDLWQALMLQFEQADDQFVCRFTHESNPFSR